LPVVSFAKRCIVVPRFSLRRQLVAKSWDWPMSSTQRHEGLFSFVASFGPHSDQYVKKQGDRRTNV